MDISRFYPAALLDEPQKTAQKSAAEPPAQAQGDGGLNQNMLMTLLPMLMGGGGGDISSVLSTLGTANGNAGNDNQMINTLATMLKNRPQAEHNTSKQKPPQQYQEADDYIFD